MLNVQNFRRDFEDVKRSEIDENDLLESKSLESVSSREHLSAKLHNTNMISTNLSDIIPGTMEIHHQLIDMFLIEPKDGSLLSIKDITTITPREGQVVLSSSIGYPITFTCEISVKKGKKRITSRRDIEIVRAKKALLRKYIKSKQTSRDIEKGKEQKRQLNYETRIEYIYSIVPSEEDYIDEEVSLKKLKTSKKRKEIVEHDSLHDKVKLKSNEENLNPHEDEQVHHLDEEQAHPGENNTSNWVKCDRCKIWRLLPSSVDMKALESEAWYCPMNTWDAKHSTCFANGMIEEGKARSIAKMLYWVGSDIGTYDCDLEGMSIVQCTHCYKLRSIPKSAKKPKNFVCPMNQWHYLLASCNAPQLDLPKLRKIYYLEKSTQENQQTPLRQFISGVDKLKMHKKHKKKLATTL